MSRSSGKDAGKVHRWQQTRAAWQVFLKRPLAIGVLLTLLPLIPAALAMFEDSPRGNLRSNVPTYTGSGKVLRETDDIRQHFESGQTDTSIVGLDFTRSVSIDYREGSSFLMLRRVRSGASGPQIAESGPFEEAGKLMLQFPSVRWIRFTGQQLRKTSPTVLNQLSKLTTIELTTTDVHAADIERISQIASIRHLKLQALWCDVDLSPLKQLPNLKSVHLTYGTMSSSEQNKAPLQSRRHVRELADVPNLEELILESGTILTDTTLYREELTSAESQSVAEIASLFSSAAKLRTVYVGYQNNGAARQALREFSSVLPGVSVRPAWYNFDVGNMLNVSWFAGIFGICLASLHFVSCCTVPQTGLVPGSESAHRRVFYCVAAVLFACQLTFLMAVAGAAVVAALAVCLISAAGTLAMMNNCFVPVSRNHRRNNNFAGALIGFVPALALCSTWMFGARIEWFLCGEQPVLATGIIMVALLVINRQTESLQAIHRRCAEHGMAPSPTLQEFMAGLGNQKQHLLSATGVERRAAAWLARLERLTASVSSGPASFLKRLKLWSIASWQMSLSQVLMRTAILLPLMFLPMLIAVSIKSGDVVRLPPVLVSPMAGMLLLIGVGVITLNLDGRFPMFAREILLPVRRQMWRGSALASTLLLMMIANGWAWLIVHVIRITLADHPNPVWALTSLLATLAFSVVGAGLAAWLVIVRRVVFSACCVALWIAAVVPAVATMTEGRGPSGNFNASFPPPDFWLSIIVLELLTGLLIFGLAWRRWVKIELAVD